MIEIMQNGASYNEVIRDNTSLNIIYGAGQLGNYVRKTGLVERIDLFCDKRSKEIKQLGNIKVILPDDLENIKGNLYILICINDNLETINKVYQELSKYNINAKLFNLFQTIPFSKLSFSVLKENKFVVNDNRLLNEISINIVCYENPNAWILGKIARKLNESLKKLGINSKISSQRDPFASINHHIIYVNYFDFPVEDNSIDTAMITHVNYQNKVDLIKRQIEYAAMQICMSKETMEWLVSIGIPRKKLCYIHPGQDGVIKPRKYILGITSKVHGDLRKNEAMLLNICEKIDNKYFKFIIMGMGWEDIVDQMKVIGFEVDYYNEFEYDKYIQIMPQIDYYLYFGFDEGSMGFLDALAAGVETIVTPQGYHMDIPNAITYPCETERDFIKCLNKISEVRKERVEAVAEWTWDAYAKKHLDIWNYLLKNHTKSQLYADAGKYSDGIFSVFFESSHE